MKYFLGFFCIMYLLYCLENSATSDYGTAQSTNNLSTLTRRSGANASGNLKSFGVPPPVINFPPGVGAVTNKSSK